MSEGVVFARVHRTASGTAVRFPWTIHELGFFHMPDDVGASRNVAGLLPF
jgi:hypothetical protein